MIKEKNKQLIVTLDLGNTALSGACWRGEELLDSWSLSTTGKPFRGLLCRELSELKEKGRPDFVLLASVVPSRTAAVKEICRSVLKGPCRLLTSATPTGLTIRYRQPRRVGADRIANAVGVYRLYGSPAIVVDFGTAITFDVVSKKFEYLGGVIAPGLTISTHALFRQAALLPRVEIHLPERILGQDTTAAIRSGVYYGTLGLVEKIIRELKKELGWGRETVLVATGGQARLILSRSRLIRIIDPLLTLKGMRLIAQQLI